MAGKQGLSDDDVRKATGKARATGKTIILRDAKTRGLQCVVSYGGSAAFSLLYTPKGAARPVRLKIGKVAPGFGVAQARIEVGRLRAEQADGIDPKLAREQEAARQRAELEAAMAQAAAREAERAALARRINVTKLVDLYFAARGNASGMKRMRQIVDYSVLPVLGTVIVDQLRKSDVQRLIDEVVARGAATQAHRVLEAFRPVLKYAIDNEYMRPEQGEPWKKLRLPETGEARERVLTARELKWLWERSDEWLATDPKLARIIKLDMLLGQRSSETCSIERGEVSADFLFWTIPGIKTKNSKPHVIPLPPKARAVMQEAVEASAGQEGPHLFVGKRGAVARADDIAHDLASAIRAWNETNPGDQVADFTPHDLRRTLATRLEETGTPMPIIEATLNHISGKKGSVTRKHYAHGDQSLAIRHALTKYQALLEQCIAGGDPFAIRTEDIRAVEARAMAEATGGKVALRVVS